MPKNFVAWILTRLVRTPCSNEQGLNGWKTARVRALSTIGSETYLSHKFKKCKIRTNNSNYIFLRNLITHLFTLVSKNLIFYQQYA